MKFLGYLRSLTANLFRRSQADDDTEEELRSHIEHRADDLERSGLDRATAERRARVEFGGHGRFKEECREALVSNFLETLVQDVRFSLRLLRKSPGFTIVAVATLALAIGANAVVFGLLNGLILRPLNVPQAESLYAIERGKDRTTTQSYPDYLELRDRNRSFDALAAWSMGAAGLDTGGNPSRVWAALVSGNYFDALRIRPYLGRLFHSSDEHGPNSAPYVVLTYAYWHSHFQDDRGVVGRRVQVNKYPFTVIGVTPRDFEGTLVFVSPDIYAPLVNEEQVQGWSGLNDRAIPSLSLVIGHLKTGVTTGQAIGDLDGIGSYLEKTYPKQDSQMAFTLGRPGLFGDFFGRPVRAFLTGLMLLAGLILLAACANLGSLFAARAADRAREVALRLALGSSRNRLVRGLFTEAVLIAVMGGTAGLWGSVALLRGFSVWHPVPRFPIHVPVNPDASVYGIALAFALVSSLLFGIVPVRQVLRTDPYQIVKSGSTGAVGRRITVRDVLLGAQIAICAVLVTSSLVAVRGLVRSLHSNFGFEPRNAMLIQTALNMAGYRGDAVGPMQERMIDAMQKIPGVTSVGLTLSPPLLNPGWAGVNVFTDETTDLRSSHAAAAPLWYSVSPGYFQAAGTALLSGRTFTWHDDEKAPRVAVINQEFARKLFGTVASAIGRCFKTADGARVEVVGVAEDGKYKNLAEDPQAAMYFPILQAPSSETFLVVRSKGDPQQLAGAIRNALRNLDAGLPFYMDTWNKDLEFALFPSRVATVSLGVLGGMGAMLSITGIFGMAAYSVTRRLRELGIRIALGAQRKQVLQAALGRAFKLLAFGSATGLLLGILASRVLSAIVYAANPRDPMVLAGVVLAMLLLGLVATWIPAQRVLSVDPLRLLRQD